MERPEPSPSSISPSAIASSGDAASSKLHDAAASLLRSIGHHYTSQRRDLVDLLDRSGQPLSIRDILARDPLLAQSSAYRNLSVLEAADIVHRIVTSDEFTRFELTERVSGHHHHHLICSSCGAVEDVTLPLSVEATVSRELDELARRHGFAPTGHQMDLLGVCATCH